MKILKLTLKKKWFDMIFSGEKTEEYREIKQYWKNRLLLPISYNTSAAFTRSLAAIARGWVIPINPQPSDFKHYDAVCFYNGGHCSKKLPNFLIELKSISVDTGRPEWGASIGEYYFVLELGKILDAQML